jgi:adenylyltransferase/sulfurtransferase
VALARSGVRRLTLVDPDRVEIHNLHRQILYRDEDVGAWKVEVARQRLARSFDGIEVKAVRERVDAANVEALLRAHDWAVDGTDSVATKLLLSDASVKTGVPVVYGGAVQLGGQAMLIRPGGPCLRCAFGSGSEEAPSCASAGVLGSLVGVVAGIQVALARAELGSSAEVGGSATLVVVNGVTLSARRVRVQRDPECSACGARRADATLDIAGEVCPMTYVRTKLKLDALAPGQLLEVLLRGAEPLKNVPRSAREEGHLVLGLTEAPEEGIFRLLIQRRA